MPKLYLGNLDWKIVESTLLTLFEELGLHPSNIVVKKGYAFVDCPDQETADRAIDYLNGYNLLGSVMQVEPSVPKQRRRTNKISIRNLPSYVNSEEVSVMCSKYGDVQNIQREENGQFVVTYENSDNATEALNGLNDQDYQGQMIKAAPVVFNNRRTNDRGYRNRGAFGRMGGRPQGGPGGMRGRDNYPLLRLLVNSDLVGAVIGKGGCTITDITQRTNARVDVLRQEKNDRMQKRLPETPIYMYGSPENVSAACKEIMKVLQAESREKLKEDFVLKMLAEDKYCGSIIGRGGKNIRAIRENSNSKITISQQHPNYAFNWDRIITIKGDPDAMSEAEKDITSRLRTCTLNDREKNEYQPMMPPPPPPYPMGPPYMPMHHHPHAAPGMYPTPPMMRNPYMMPPPHHHHPMHQGDIYGNAARYPNLPPSVAPREKPPEEETFIKVPDGAASVIIGPKGSIIKSIQEKSGAFIHVHPEKRDKNDTNPPRIPEGIPVPRDPKERVIVIKGDWEAHWRAHFYVFEKLKSQGFAGNEEVKLSVIMKVPRLCVGRIIGKDGRNVKDTQVRSGAIVTALNEDHYYPPSGDYKFVEIVGSFTATQGAMCRVRSKIPGSGCNAYQQNNKRAGGGGNNNVAHGNGGVMQRPPMNGN